MLLAVVSPSTVPVLAALLAFAGQPPAPPALAPVVAAVPIIPPSPPSGGDETCPSARQVADALQAHLPGLVQTADRAAARQDALQAVLDVPSDGTVVHFSLIDARGDVQLRRSIPGPGRGHPPADCLALAETLAEIVERYLSSVLYQARETTPPPPPAPPPAPSVQAPEVPKGRAGYLFVGGAWMMASSNDHSVLAGRLGFDLELTHRPFALVAEVTAGIAQEEKATLTNGPVASLRRFPAHAGLALQLPAGPGTFEPCITAGVEVLLAGSTDMVTGRTVRSYRYSPVVSAETGYRVTLGRHFFIRPRASLGFAIVRYDIAIGDPHQPVFSTPSTFSTFGLDAGLVFR